MDARCESERIANKGFNLMTSNIIVYSKSLPLHLLGFSYIAQRYKEAATA